MLRDTGLSGLCSVLGVKLGQVPAQGRSEHGWAGFTQPHGPLQECCKHFSPVQWGPSIGQLLQALGGLPLVTFLSLGMRWFVFGGVVALGDGFSGSLWQGTAPRVSVTQQER